MKECNRFQARTIAHSRINDWANKRHIESMGGGSSLWYSSDSPEGKLIKERGVVVRGAAKSKVPNCFADPEYAKMNYIMDGAPAELRQVAKFKYETPGLEGQKIRAFIDETGTSYRTYYRRIDELWDYVIDKLGIPVRVNV